MEGRNFYRIIGMTVCLVTVYVLSFSQAIPGSSRAGMELRIGNSSALDYLMRQISAANKQMVVFRDYGDGSNLFTQRALMNTSGKNYPVMDEMSPSPYGVSCIHVTYKMTSSDWNGYSFITGYMAKGDTEPTLDFGDHDTGFDLTGATKLTFKAKGATGNESVKFYFGGLGGTSAPYHDSDEVFLTTDNNGFITLTSDWKEYTIDLKGNDLSRIACGFAWVTSEPENHGLANVEFYLDDIIFHFDFERNDPLFLRSYAPLPLDDERSVINNISYVYDNAILAILLAQTGHVNYAVQIANALEFCVDNDSEYQSGIIRNGYVNGYPLSFPGWYSPKGSMFARLPGYPVPDLYASSLNAGVMAWTIEALLTVYEKTDATRFLNTAKLLAEQIIYNFGSNDAAGGFTGGIEGLDKTKLTYKSCEHNEDIYAAFKHLANELKKGNDPADIALAAKYLGEAKKARDFVLSMYEDGCFWVGTTNDGLTINKSNRALDAHTWGILTLINDGEITGKWNSGKVYEFASKTFARGDYKYEYNDTDTDPTNWWREGTAQMAVVALQLGKTADYERIMQNLNAAAEEDGSICAAAKDSLTTGFETIIVNENGDISYVPWYYDHRVSLASTVWLAFAQLYRSPYWVDNERIDAPVASALNVNYIDGSLKLSGLSGGETVTVYDVNGRQFLTQKTSNVSATIDVSALADGIYLVKVADGSKAATEKVFIRR